MPEPLFQPVLLLPTFNNAATLRAVVEGALKLGHPVIVVDDGSDAPAAALLEGLGGGGECDLTVDTHPHNRGKAEALRTGFATAAARGFTHALTIDTDGQHDLADAPALLAAAKADPSAFVTGCRDEMDPAYPAKNRAGRRWSNLAIFLIGGRRVSDSQCGYRVYPLAMVAALPCRAGRYGYEAEMLVRSGWAKTPLAEVPVRTIYAPPGERVSHFKPWRDTLHAFAIYGRLGRGRCGRGPTGAGPNRRRNSRRRGRRCGDACCRGSTRASCWRRARGDDVSRASVAAGLGVGAFVGNLPVYPVQTLVAVYLAKRLHLHPVAAVAGSQVAFPPFNVILSAAAIWLGHLILWQSTPAWTDFTERTWDFHGVRTLMEQYFFAWALGGVIIGVVMGVAVFLLAWAGLKWVPKRALARGGGLKVRNSGVREHRERKGRTTRRLSRLTSP